MQAGSVPVRRRGRIVPAAVALLVGSWLLAAAPAAAHALVVGSNPQAGARIARAPAELRVAFSEAVRPLGPGLTLQGPSGGQVRLGSVRHPDGRPEVLAATLPTLGDGSYLAGWRIVSADDGHLEAGSFAFAVGTGSGPVTSPAPSQLPTPWQVAGRWLETAGVLGLVGVVVAALAIWHRPEPIGPDEPRWWALTVAAAAVGAVGLAWQVAAGAATVGGRGRHAGARGARHRPRPALAVPSPGGRAPAGGRRLDRRASRAGAHRPPSQAGGGAPLLGPGPARRAGGRGHRHLAGPGPGVQPRRAHRHRLRPRPGRQGRGVSGGPEPGGRGPLPPAAPRQRRRGGRRDPRRAAPPAGHRGHRRRGGRAGGGAAGQHRPGRRGPGRCQRRPRARRCAGPAA